MRVLSCFVDEASQQDMGAGYYMLTLVLHDQSKGIAGNIAAYEARLALEGLPDIPFHDVELLHGHGPYANIGVETRKRLLVAFSMFVRTLPISYHTFKYMSTDVKAAEILQAGMRRDVVNFVFDHLGDFHDFDRVAVYYDDGQATVKAALHEAFDYALVRDATEYKRLLHQDKRLAQAADYLCSIERADMMYGRGGVSATYGRFYGTPRNFRQNFLKQARRKLIV